VEYFYSEAKKKHDEKHSPPSESEFRYAGDNPKPHTKEAAIVMLSDSVEGAVRSMSGELTPTKIEAAVHNMSMKRLQDGQFDECELSLRELSQIEKSISKTLAAHHHGRIAYPKAPDEPEEAPARPAKNNKKNNK
jgi:membrane-associated HD superfamily phosphohydrolase